jgi:hypothetical protein
MDHDPDEVAEYLWGDLDADAAGRFERHLVDCDQCWAAVRDDARGRAIVESGRQPAPPGLRDRIRFAVETESRTSPPSKRRRFRRVAIGLTAIIIAAATATGVDLLVRPGHSSDPPSVAAVLRLAEPGGTGLNTAPTTRLLAHGQLISLTRLQLNGTTVLVARSDRPFPAASGAQAMTSDASPWVTSRGPLTMVCFNYPHAVLVTARLPAALLTPLASRLSTMTT